MKTTTAFFAVALALSSSAAIAQTGGGAASSSGSANTAGMSSSSTGTEKVERPAAARDQNSGSPMNSSQADYNSSLKDGSAPGTTGGEKSNQK
jgi:hypothetical protein